MTDLDKLAPALVALQAELTPVGKSAKGVFANYAPLPEVVEHVKSLLQEHGLAISQFPTHINGQSALRTILMHESGQYVDETAPLLLAKSDPQGQASAITYARRYNFMAALGMTAQNEDDDGHAATQSYRQPETYAEEQPAATNPLFDMRQQVTDASGGATRDEIAAAYKEWSGDRNILAASVPELQKYLDHLLGKTA